MRGIIAGMGAKPRPDSGGTRGPEGRPGRRSDGPFWPTSGWRASLFLTFVRLRAGARAGRARRCGLVRDRAVQPSSETPHAGQERCSRLRPQDRQRLCRGRHGKPRLRGRDWHPRRTDRRRRRGAGQRGGDDRRGGAGGVPRVRRHSHPLRRPDHVGPHAHHLALARGDDGGDGELRLLGGPHPARAPRDDRPDPRERRGDDGRGPPRGARGRMALRNVPRVPRCRRAPWPRHQRRGSHRPYRAPDLGHGRGRDRARGDGGRD